MKNCFMALVVFCLSVCTALAQPSIAATTTTLTVTANGNAVATTSQGTAVTLTATVTAAGAPVVPGQVDFCDAAAMLCSDIHLLGTAQLTSAGTAAIKFMPGPGTHSYKAVFVGTTVDAGSASASSSLTVTAAALDASTTTIVSSGNPGSYTLTATVTGKGAIAPSGTISFLDTSNANYLLATAPLIPNAGSPGTLSFLNSSNPATGQYPQSVVIGDFNGDGKPDMAVPVYSGGGPIVDVLLGNGDGTFQAAPPVSVTGMNAGYAAIADFNGDGKPDIAVTLPDNGSIVVLLGNGDGTFTPEPQTPATAFQLAAADLNGDGIPDLAVVGGGANVTILLGKGDGTFTTGSTLTASNDTTSVAIGDFNGDGIPDLATTIFPYGGTLGSGVNVPGTVEIFLGKGDGTFTAMATEPTVGYSPSDVVAADLNGDGVLDLAVANLASDSNYPATVTVLLGKGDGTFTPTTQNLLTGALPYSVAIGDFNGDGVPDLATANAGSNTATVFLGNGDGTFANGPTPSLGTNPIYAAVGDFNGDGLSDIAGADNYPVFQASVLLAQESETQTAVATTSGISIVGTGTHLVDASYPGDDNYESSTSGTVALTAEPVPTTLTLNASPSAVNFGQAVLLTATLAPSVAQNHAASGVVTFSLGSAVLGTGTLSGGTATLSLQSLPVGVDTVTATYPGDTNFAAPTPATILVTVSLGAPVATTTTLSASPNPAVSGTAVTFTAAVSSVAGIPAGPVSFYDGSTLLGTATLAAGTTSYSTSALSVGGHSITASYGGSPEFAQSTSSATTETISPAPGFSLTVQPATKTVTAGSAAVYSLSVVPQTGFNQPVTLSCSGLVAGTTCSFSPATVSGGSGTSTLTVQTAATQAKNIYVGGGGLMAMAGLVFLCLPFGARRRLRSGLMAAWLFVALAIGAASVTGCNASVLQTTQTSSTTQTIQITGATSGGSQSISATATVNLIVQTGN